MEPTKAYSNPVYSIGHPTLSYTSSGDSVSTSVSDASSVCRYIERLLVNEDGSPKPIACPQHRKEIVINLMTNFIVLQENMTSSKRIAEVMHEEKYISRKELKKISDDSSRNTFDANCNLLLCVLKRAVPRLFETPHFDRIHCFLMGLKATNQKDLLILLLKKGSKLHRPHQEWIRKSYTYLSDNLTIDPSLLNHLFQLGVLHDYEKQDILSCSLSHMQVTNLLNLLSLKSLDCYEKFLVALAENRQEYIVDRLNASRAAAGRGNMNGWKYESSMMDSVSNRAESIASSSDNICLELVQEANLNSRAQCSRRNREQNIIRLASELTSLRELLKHELRRDLSTVPEETVRSESDYYTERCTLIPEENSRIHSLDRVRIRLMACVDAAEDYRLLRGMYQSGNRQAVLLEENKQL